MDKKEPWHTWTQAALTAACKNIGTDLTCGRCAMAFFTGTNLGEPHDAHCSSLLGNENRTTTDLAKAIEALDGEIQIDGDDGSKAVVQACSEYAEAVKLIPERCLDPEGGTLPDAIRGLVSFYKEYEKVEDATDKAVCPVCGHEFDPTNDDGKISYGQLCPKCDSTFDVEVVVSVISPPREPKETT